jgi:uncharacterized protein YaaQ
MPREWRHVLFWGGLRGAIALALALSLPFDLGAERQTVILMTFGVVLFTLVVQGLSMGSLIERLRLVVRSEDQQEYEKRHARALAAQASFDHLQEMRRDGLISGHTWEALKPMLERRTEALTRAVQETLRNAPELEIEEMTTARRESLRAQRSMLSSLRRDGIIAEEIYRELVTEVDAALDSGATFWSRSILASPHTEEVSSMLAAVVQQRDLEAASNALALQGVPITRVDSHGGFLRQRNHILFVGIPEGALEETIETLQTSTQQRVEFLPTPLQAMEAASQEVEVHGAVVFLFDVDRYEEI